MNRLPAGFSVALSLAFILPFLNYFRDPPIGDFYGEWAGAVFFVVAAAFALRYVDRFGAFAVSLLIGPAALLGLLAVQLAAGSIEFPTDIALWCGYLALLALALAIGQAARQSGRLAQVVDVLCWTLLVTATLNVLLQLAQVTQLDKSLQPYVMPLIDRSLCRPYGNTGQPNHAAALAALGLAALVRLTLDRGLARWVAVATGAVLLLGLALTASRMAVLFAGMLALSFWLLPAWRFRSRSSSALAGFALLGGFLLANWIVGTWLLPSYGDACATATGRIIHETSSLPVRWELWRQALMVWESSPWIGVGPGNFMGKVYALEQFGRQQPLDFYAHNSALQVLAEFGLLGFLPLCAVVFGWLAMLWKRRDVSGRPEAVLIAWLGVIAIHSLLEFPLWYVQFLVLCGLCLGLLIEPNQRSPLQRFPYRAAVGSLSLLIAAGAALLAVDYRRLDQAMFMLNLMLNNPGARNPVAQQSLAAAFDDVRVLRVHADHAAQLLMPLDTKDVDGKIAATDRILRKAPVAENIERRVILAAMAGDLRMARLHLRRLLMFYPHRATPLLEHLRTLARQRPDLLAALGPILEEESARAPQPRW